MTNSGKQMMADAKFYMGYSRWIEKENRYETWEESVDRVMDMHRQKYSDKLTFELNELFHYAADAYKDKLVLGSQRALQFGGKQLLDKEARNYNCSFSHVDRPEFFQECMYLLLCGCGVGFSVQTQHIQHLPSIAKPDHTQCLVFEVPDSIEGWSDAFGVLLSTYFTEDAPFPEYKGKRVHFDFSKIRPKGSPISGGFKAPGADGLRESLIMCEKLLDKEVDGGQTRIRPIVAYDFVMHMANAVLSGGVRRSATICIFSKEDNEMMTAKTGDWFVNNPQRGRSNNSVALLRDEVTREEFAEIMQSVKSYGEPGFIFTDDLDFGYNPCVEISLYPKTQDGRTGFQMCNLSEINGSACIDEESFMRATKAAAILGTLQAGYTDFKYVSSATKEITDREALLGVSITGWMNHPEFLFDEETMKKGAENVKYWNKIVAEMIGINQSARTTCTKPSGNASVLLGTASGIHGEHSPRYFRNVQMNEMDDVLSVLEQTNPKMVEKSVWSATGTDKVVSFPIVSDPDSIFKNDLLGVKQLEYVKKAQQVWVEYGTNVDLCVHPKLRHNISNTITVDDWDAVEQYIYDNRHYFAGISLLAAAGDKAYAQAPFTEVLTSEQIFSKYGVGSMFASGLIVDGLHAFDNRLWLACDTVQGFGEKLDPENSADLLKRDWVRRAKKFANNYFNQDVQLMTDCLKDCYNLHRWESITRSMKPVDFVNSLCKSKTVEIDTIGAVNCNGGQCEVTF